MRLLFPIIALFVFLWGLVYLAGNARPILFWAYLLTAPSLLAALTDLVERRLSIRRIPYLYSKNLYRVVTTLLLVLLPLPILFLLGPVGVVSILLMLGDLLFGILPDVMNDEPVRPVLCAMTGVDQATCIPALSIWFTVYGLSVVVALKYGERAYDYLITLVRRASPF